MMTAQQTHAVREKERRSLRPIGWLIVALLLCASAPAAEVPKGTPPRGAADQYPAHAEQSGVAIGANPLSADQARQALAADLNRCCMVIEVALFPAKDGSFRISLDQFALRVVGAESATRPSRPSAVAGMLERKAEPQQGDREMSNPVSLEFGARARLLAASFLLVSRSEAVQAEQRSAEEELTAKALPEGDVTAPVAGYVYFAVDKTRRFTYQLEYTLRGEKVIMPLP